MTKTYKYLRSTMVIFFLVWVFSLPAQETWENWTNSDHVTDIQEVGNEIWIATKGGLVIYDPQSGQKTFLNSFNSALPSNQIETIALDSDQDPWIGTYDAGIIARKNGQWILFNKDNSKLNSNIIYEIVRGDNGHMYIGTVFGLSEYDGQGFINHHLPIYEGVNTLVYRSSTDILVGWSYNANYMTKIYNYDGQHFEVDTNFNHRGLYKMYEDNSGNIWACHSEGISMNDGSNWTTFDSTNTILPDARTFAFFDDKGKKYVGTGKGLYRFENNQWYPETDISSISLQEISYINKMSDGSLWIGSFENSIGILDGSHWKHQDMSSSPINGNKISFLEKGGNGNIYFSSAYEPYIQYYHKGVWNNIALPGDKILFNTSSVVDASGAVYVSDFEEVIWKYDGNKWIDIHLPGTTGHFGILNLFVDSSGDLWVGTYNKGLFKYDGANWTNWTKQNSVLNSSHIRPELTDPNGNIWFSLLPYYDNYTQKYYGGGLAKYDGSDFTTYHSDNTPLTQNQVSELIWVGDRLYFLSSGVLWSFDGTTWDSYSFADGSLPVFPYVLTADNNGQLFTLGYHIYGVTAMAKKDVNGWKVVADTLPFHYNKIYEFIADDENTLWIGTDMQGMIRYNEKGIPVNTGLENERADEILWNVFPVPSVDQVTIEFQLKEPGNVKIELVDMQGKTVIAIPEKYIDTAFVQETLNLRHINAGNYLIKMSTNDRVMIKQIVKVE